MGQSLAQRPVQDVKISLRQRPSGCIRREEVINDFSQINCLIQAGLCGFGILICQLQKGRSLGGD